jgi:Zn-dependent metalloprotease
MATPKKITLVTLIAVIGLLAYILFFNGSSEAENNQCINNILMASNNHALIIETKNRGNTPILKGTASMKNKTNIIKLIREQCGPIEIQDFIEIINEVPSKLPFISFEIDNVNSIIIIDGMVNNTLEASTIIDSFNNAFIDQNKTFTIKHDIKSNDAIKPAELDLSITLLMPSIKLIQMAKVSIKDNTLTLKGLVRDKLREKETIDILEALFADELFIINQLEPVVKHAPEIEKFKYKLAPLPKIDQQ